MYYSENNIIKTDEFPLNEEYAGGLGYLCFNLMKKHGENIAQIDLSTNEEESYNSLLLKCIRTGIALQKMGIKEGDVVTFCSETNLNSCVPLIACFLIGAVPSYIDMTLPFIETERFMMNINPELFLVTPDFLKTVDSFAKSNDKSAKVVAFTQDFFNPVEEEAEFIPVYVNDLQKTAIIHFSSGSTGFPKAICVKHYTFVANKSLEDLWLEDEPRVTLSYDSFHWFVETLRLICSVKEGACRLMAPTQFSAERTWTILEEYKVTVAYLIPLVLVNMVECGKPKDIDLENLRTIVAEGSLLPGKYQEALQKLLPNVGIFQSYGQTEAGELTAFRNIDLHREYSRKKLESVGLPVHDIGISLKVVDLENGKILGPNQRGELCVKGKTVMNGYHNLDSSDQFDEDGWLKTGDVAYYDEDFCFFIVGRVKELIVFQGWHIAPAILEAELLAHPAVKLAVVIGVDDSESTELPMGLVTLHTHFNDVAPIEIEKYIEERVPDMYRLRGGVKIVEESYLKGTNKVKRLKLKQLVSSGEI